MSTLALVSIIVTSAALFGWLSIRVIRLPITIGTMLLTVIASVLMMFLGRAVPALPAWAISLAGRVRFEDLILHGMLGLLLFAGAFLLDLDYLFREKLSVTLLAVIGTLLSTAGIAVLMHFTLPLLGIPAPWLECLFFGTLISPTDPVAVLEMLHRVGVPKNIQAQLAGESLFNDGIGAVLFLAVLAASRGQAPSLSHLGALLVIESGGGLILGIALAKIASELMRRVEAYQVEVLLTLALALGGYALAETLRLSAPLEAVAAGLALRHFNMGHTHAEISHDSLDRFWRVIDEVQNAILFALLGFEVLLIPFTSHSFESGGLAILAVTLVRIAVVTLVLSLVRLLQPGHASSLITLSWGGLRGGLSIALALSVPYLYSHTWILATTYLVVVFSVVLQGGTLDLFLKRAGRFQ
ncbi:sodium:proton antiporter [Granulicella sp. 5B5]|uniref:cation:proton antiporter n=1 Tax=Granulicella sp. 5B5 TaxID=1617967 RepID=UPI0015F4421A|nr:sodium:proton antiporter [Granulicella sp. 5B5]QMV17917.1 sodium:proton antiporter [Granulicella sp. 5B5]